MEEMQKDFLQYYELLKKLLQKLKKVTSEEETS